MAKRIVFGIMFFLYGIVFGQESNKVSIYKGNRSFNNQNFDEASSHYLRAIEKNNKDFKSHYNLGNTLYKKKMYRDAMAEYEKAIDNAQSNEEKKSALYNLGNAHYLDNDRKSAIEFYKQALSMDPQNEAILRNLRIAKKQEDQKDKDSKKQDENRRNNTENTKSSNENREEKSDKKKRNKEEEDLLDQIQQREQNTAERALKSRGYTQPQSKRKDW